jgi:hypothetical protein
MNNQQTLGFPRQEPNHGVDADVRTDFDTVGGAEEDHPRGEVKDKLVRPDHTHVEAEAKNDFDEHDCGHHNEKEGDDSLLHAGQEACDHARGLSPEAVSFRVASSTCCARA